MQWVTLTLVVLRQFKGQRWIERIRRVRSHVSCSEWETADTLSIQRYMGMNSTAVFMIADMQRRLLMSSLP